MVTVVLTSLCSALLRLKKNQHFLCRNLTFKTVVCQQHWNTIVTFAKLTIPYTKQLIIRTWLSRGCWPFPLPKQVFAIRPHYRPAPLWPRRASLQPSLPHLPPLTPAPSSPCLPALSERELTLRWMLTSQRMRAGQMLHCCCDPLRQGSIWLRTF